MQKEVQWMIRKRFKAKMNDHGKLTGRVFAFGQYLEAGSMESWLMAGASVRLLE